MLYDAAEKLISAGLLPADAFVYESPEAAEAYVASGKAISHEREGAELELLTASKRIDDFISGLQTHQRLSQTALNTQQIRGMHPFKAYNNVSMPRLQCHFTEEQRCKPELSAITDQFTRLCEDVSNLSTNTTTLLEAYSHLVDYITAQTVLLDKEIPKT